MKINNLSVHRRAIYRIIYANAIGLSSEQPLPIQAILGVHENRATPLPAPRHRGGGGQPRGLGQAVAAPSGVPDRVNDVEELVLLLVSSAVSGTS